MFGSGRVLAKSEEKERNVRGVRGHCNKSVRLCCRSFLRGHSFSSCRPIFFFIPVSAAASIPKTNGTRRDGRRAWPWRERREKKKIKREREKERWQRKMRRRDWCTKKGCRALSDSSRERWRINNKLQAYNLVVLLRHELGRDFLSIMRKIYRDRTYTRRLR